MDLINEEPFRLVKELKGAPLAILMLLSLAPVPVSREWLEVHAGYSDKPVAKALAYLQEHGFILKTTGGWQISADCHRLPFPLGPAFPPSEAGMDLSQAGMGPIENADTDTDISIRYAPDSSTPPSTGIRNFSGNNRNFSDPSPHASGEIRNFSDSSTPPSTGIRNFSGNNRNFSDPSPHASGENRNFSDSSTPPSTGIRNFSGNNRNFSDPSPHASGENRNFSDSSTPPLTGIRNFSGNNRNFSDPSPHASGENRNFSVKNRNFSESPLISSSSSNLNLKESNTTTTNRENRNFSGSLLSPGHQLGACYLAEHDISLNDRTRPLLGVISCDDILIVARELSTQKQAGPGRPVRGPPGAKGCPGPGILGSHRWTALA